MEPSKWGGAFSLWSMNVGGYVKPQKIFDVPLVFCVVNLLSIASRFCICILQLISKRSYLLRRQLISSLSFSSICNGPTNWMARRAERQQGSGSEWHESSNEYLSLPLRQRCASNQLFSLCCNTLCAEKGKKKKELILQRRFWSPMKEVEILNSSLPQKWKFVEHKILSLQKMLIISCERCRNTKMEIYRAWNSLVVDEGIPCSTNFFLYSRVESCISTSPIWNQNPLHWGKSVHFCFPCAEWSVVSNDEKVGYVQKSG